MKKIDVPPLFGRTSTLIHQIDDFLDQVSEGALVFEEGVGIFTERGVDDSCEVKLQHLHELKKHASKVGRDIVTSVYAQMLVPDARADILELVAALNRILDILHNKFSDITIFNEKSTRRGQKWFHGTYFSCRQNGGIHHKSRARLF